jgi:hypothetical protein
VLAWVGLANLATRVVISKNVAGVKYFWSTLRQARQRKRHFAIVENNQTNHGSLTIVAVRDPVRPNHLFDHIRDHGYCFELPSPFGWLVPAKSLLGLRIRCCCGIIAQPIIKRESPRGLLVYCRFLISNPCGGDLHITARGSWRCRAAVVSGSSRRHQLFPDYPPARLPCCWW